MKSPYGERSIKYVLYCIVLYCIVLYCKSAKYAALKWELKQRHKGYEIEQFNIIIDRLVGFSEDLEATEKNTKPSNIRKDAEVSYNKHFE